MRRLLLLALLVSAQSAPAEDWLYLTYPGDYPLKISRTYMRDPKDWDKLLMVNKVKNEYVLPVNTRIRIPVELLKVTPAPVAVSHIEGNVRVKSDGGVFRPLSVGDKLTGGETVLTGPRSFAAYVLADGSKLTQQASSKLTFGRLAAYGKTGMVSTELNLENGRIEAGASKQIGPAGGFKVRTPVAVAGLRGTAFRLNVSDDGRFLRNEVLEGVVAVEAQDQEVEVGASQGTVTEQGKPPEPPRPLLPPPNLDELPARVVTLPLSFTWPDLPEAKGWRAQIATDAEFQKIVLDGNTDKAEIAWQEAPPDGHYFLRVRAVDAAGLEGRNADRPFELDALPMAPQQVAPSDAARSYQEQVTFSWAAAPEAQGYQLQVAPSADFPDDKTLSRKLDAVLSQTEQLAPGNYYWRLASLDETGQAHVWGPARSLRVQPLPLPPKGEVKPDNGRAGFAWLPVAGAASYDLEIAGRNEFSAPDVRLHVSESKASVPLKPGKYYWRMRALEADGQAGAWGKAAPLVMPPEAPYDIQVVWTESTVTLTWRGIAPGFRLEFARDPEFHRPLFNHRVDVNIAELDNLFAPGQYWVRIISMSETGTYVGTSKPVAFIIRPYHDSPIPHYATDAARGGR